MKYRITYIHPEDERQLRYSYVVTKEILKQAKEIPWILITRIKPLGRRYVKKNE